LPHKRREEIRHLLKIIPHSCHEPYSSACPNHLKSYPTLDPEGMSKLITRETMSPTTSFNYKMKNKHTVTLYDLPASFYAFHTPA
jgi:hypothetical protein